MEHYYEISLGDHLYSFENLDDAIDFANLNICNMICEIGGSWIDYQQCSLCGEWVDCCELNESCECEYCQQALKSKGEY